MHLHADPVVNGMPTVCSGLIFESSEKGYGERLATITLPAGTYTCIHAVVYHFYMYVVP